MIRSVKVTSLFWVLCLNALVLIQNSSGVFTIVTVHRSDLFDGNVAVAGQYRTRALRI